MKKDLFNLESEKHLVKNSKQFVVTPSLPDKLKPLIDIAYNIWWVWNSEAHELFRRVDRDLWEEVYHNPIRLLGLIKQERLAELAEDNSFISHLERIVSDLNRYLNSNTWYSSVFPEQKDCKIAYFSTEFGVHESIPIYSGGLGLLSGDHLKSASDMGLPLVGVGLLYRFGYFKQYLTAAGWQQEEYEEAHFFRMPFQRVTDAGGNQIKIFVEHAARKVYAQVWKVMIGRIPLYLLDTDIDENITEDREITGQLYGGDREMRIKQETVLGIGGMRALKAMGIEPSVIHINEGHSAFLILERIKTIMADYKLNFDEASEVVRATSVFTTHTPVPAGNEVFSPELVTKYLEPIYKKINLSKDEFLALGKVNPGDPKEQFCLTVLALKMTDYANGVSKLHGTISRDMWKDIWPELPKSEVPITHITNGVHTNTWISYETAMLFDRYLGTTWKDEPSDQSIWENISSIPESELWRSHERRRERLVSFARARLKTQLIRRGASPTEIEYADEVLDPEALTICFAKRFVAYKRSYLLFSDLPRLKEMLMQKGKPVQIIVAGKSHPQDNIGKDFIKQIIHITRDIDHRRRIVFIEDYDMNVAHYMVQGANIWLNNPRRPYEASGTSGMKAAANGVLNFSVLDGWWCEAYNGENGWVIGSGEEYQNTDYQDEIESKAIYDILQKDVIPLFYSRTLDGIPREWIKKMKTSMRTICPQFNTNRMIEEYTKKCYNQATAQYNKMKKDNFDWVRKCSVWKKTTAQNWPSVKVQSVEDNFDGNMNLGNTFKVRAKIQLGSIKPEDVSVQIFWGYQDSKNRIYDAGVIPMKLKESLPDQSCVFEGTVTGDRVGHCGYVVRVLPQYEGKVLIMPRLITWQ